MTWSDSMAEIRLFQFHKGTIRTLLPMCQGRHTDRFQFHKGTIRTKIDEYYNTLRLISIP